MNSFTKSLFAALLLLVTAVNSAEAQFRIGIGGGDFSSQGRSSRESGGLGFGINIPIPLPRPSQGYRQPVAPPPRQQPQERPLSAAENQELALGLERLSWLDEKPDESSSGDGPDWIVKTDYSRPMLVAWAVFAEEMEAWQSPPRAAQTFASTAPPRAYQASDVRPTWVGDPPPDDGKIDAAVKKVLEALPLPREVIDAIRFDWRGNAPHELSYTVWADLERSVLLVGPAFLDTHILSAECRLQLATFELGKLIFDKGKLQRNKLVQGFLGQLPPDLFRLPCFSQADQDQGLSPFEQDAASRFGYAYYHFLFKRDKLKQMRAAGVPKLLDKKKGSETGAPGQPILKDDPPQKPTIDESGKKDTPAEGLIRQWTNNPPHDVLK